MKYEITHICLSLQINKQKGKRGKRKTHIFEKDAADESAFWRQCGRQQQRQCYWPKHACERRCERDFFARCGAIQQCNECDKQRGGDVLVHSIPVFRRDGCNDVCGVKLLEQQRPRGSVRIVYAFWRASGTICGHLELQRSSGRNRNTSVDCHRSVRRRSIDAALKTRSELDAVENGCQ